jgi:obg-like ATPase 1
LKEEEATVAKILQWLQDGKDVRKGDWTPKEVEFPPSSPPLS